MLTFPRWKAFGSFNIRLQDRQRPSASASGSARPSLEPVRARLSFPTSSLLVSMSSAAVWTRSIWHGPPFPIAARQPGPDPDRKSYQSFFSFDDPDGNTWIVQEVTKRLPGRC